MFSAAQRRRLFPIVSPPGAVLASGFLLPKVPGIMNDLTAATDVLVRPIPCF